MKLSRCQGLRRKYSISTAYLLYVVTKIYFGKLSFVFCRTQYQRLSRLKKQNDAVATNNEFITILTYRFLQSESLRKKIKFIELFGLADSKRFVLINNFPTFSS